MMLLQFSCSVIKKMNRSLLILNVISETRFCMSTKAKVPTHYETLEVEQDCTQGEIKSAYYEMSKKYHPDRNKSTDAKKQFQSVSDAYEILGNFSKRKQYDLDLSARGQKTTATTSGVVYERRRPVYEKRKDPSTAYRSTSNYDHMRSRQMGQHYDYDEWVYAHYHSYLLRKSVLEKRQAYMKEKRRKEMEELEKESETFMTCILLLIIITLTICTREMNYRHDRELFLKHKEQNKDGKS